MPKARVVQVPQARPAVLPGQFALRVFAALATRTRLAARQLPILGRSWPAWVSAIVFGLLLAMAGYAIGSKPERYPDFIVGSIAWGAANKSADYWLLCFFVAG